MHIGFLIVEEENANWFANCGGRECLLVFELLRKRVLIGFLIVEEESAYWFANCGGREGLLVC